MIDPVTYQLVPVDASGKGKVKKLEDVVLDVLTGGNHRLFVVNADGSRGDEVYVSEASHSRGHSEFDPRDAKKDRHGPHRGGKKNDDGIVTFTITPVA